MSTTERADRSTRTRRTRAPAVLAPVAVLGAFAGTLVLPGTFIGFAVAGLLVGGLAGRRLVRARRERSESERR